MSQPSLVAVVLLSFTGCVEAPLDHRLPPTPAPVGDGKADIVLPSLCEGDAALIVAATKRIETVLDDAGVLDKNFTGHGFQKRSSLEAGRVLRQDLNGDGVDEAIVFTNDDYFDPDFSLTEKGIITYATVPGFDPCIGFPIAFWTGVDVLPSEDEEDVGEENFRNLDVERGGTFCQFDTYRMNKLYEFVTSRDGCEAPDDVE